MRVGGCVCRVRWWACVTVVVEGGGVVSCSRRGGTELGWPVPATAAVSLRRSATAPHPPQRWDSILHLLLSSREFPKMQGSCLAYSRDGALLVAGFASGHLHILNADDCSDAVVSFELGRAL